MSQLGFAPTGTVLRKSLFSAVCLVSLATPALSWEEYTNAAGGQGGSRFELRGRGPMLGLRMRIGALIDNVEGLYVGKVGGRIESMGKAGGSGGRSVEVMCPRGQVIKGIQVTPVNAPGGPFVGEIRPGCVSAANPDARAGLVSTGWNGDRRQPAKWLACKPGQVATGIIGRSGTFVDQVGLICNDTTSMFVEDVLKAIAITAARSQSQTGSGDGSAPISGKKKKRATNGKEGLCTDYAEDALAKSDLNEQWQCGLRGSRYSDEFDTHFSWCMGSMEGTVEGEKRARAFEISNCVDRVCRDYANDARDKAEENIDSDCGYQGDRFSTDYNAHYTWCKGVSPSLVRKERKVRDKAIRNCL